MAEKKKEESEGKAKMSLGGLMDVYNKLEEAVDLLAEKAPDALDRFVEINQKVTDSAKELSAWLRSQKAKASPEAAEEQEEACACLAKLRDRCHVVATGSTRGSTKSKATATKEMGMSPEMRSILAQTIRTLIDAILEKVGG